MKFCCGEGNLENEDAMRRRRLEEQLAETRALVELRESRIAALEAELELM